MSSGANDATTCSAGPGTAAVTSPRTRAHRRKAVIAGAPALPPAAPNAPPTTKDVTEVPFISRRRARSLCQCQRRAGPIEVERGNDRRIR